MKKTLIILAIIFGILISALIAIPFIFKDDIRQAIDNTIDESLNAQVFYDIDKFNLSLFKNFPDLTVSMGDFGIVGIEEFETDTLTSISSFQITVDLMSVISGDIRVEEILLEEPQIFILVLEDGKANYDIAKETGTETTAQEAPSEGEAPDMKISVKKWKISDAQVIYFDQSMNFYTTLIGLNHEGSGDFTLDVFDLKTQTTVDNVSLGYDGTEYVSNKQLDADVTLNMDLGEMKFTFKENKISVNQFAMGAEGYISMPGEDIDMDITFGGQDIDLKSILSLIPGTYQEYLDGVSASGNVGFDGYIKGTYNEQSMPAIAANLSVADGKITYADYPVPMEDISITSSFSYPSADLRETRIDVDNFSMLVDGEPLAAHLTFQNLEDYQWDFGLDGNADLEKITKIIPLEGMELKGKINAQLKTAGKMSDLEAERYANLPTSGSLAINQFSFKSEDLTQDFGIQSARLELDPNQASLTDFQATAGKSDIQLTGSISNYLGYVLEENKKLVGQFNFRSSLLDLNEWMTTEEVTEEEETIGESAPLEVVKIPENIDFVLQSTVDQINYTNLSLTEFNGQVTIRDGAIVLDENSFEMLDGTFSLSGSYDTKDLENPAYDLSFGIKELSISNAFSSFQTIQKYIPIAQQVTGKFSTDFKVTGLLGQDMMPLFDNIDLSGLVNIAQATLEKGSFLDNISTFAAFKGSASGDSKKSISLKDVLISTTIQDGRLYIKPFDLEVNGQKATLGGSNGLDGSLEYSMLIQDIPTGQIGNTLNSALSAVTGGQKLIADNIDLNLGIGGTYKDPKINLLGSSDSDGDNTTATAELKQQVDAKIDEQKQKAEEELAKQKAAVEAKADSAAAVLEAKKEAAEEEAKRKLEEEKKKAEEAAKDKLKDLFKKKGGGK